MLEGGGGLASAFLAAGVVTHAIVVQVKREVFGREGCVSGGIGKDRGGLIDRDFRKVGEYELEEGGDVVECWMRRGEGQGEGWIGGGSVDSWP